MASNLSQLGSRERENPFDKVLDTTRLRGCRPSAGQGVTIIRLLPEVTPQGEILPCIVPGSSTSDPAVNGCTTEHVTILAGFENKWTGLSRASDQRADTAASQMVFPGLFIRLRGRQKKHEIPTELMDLVSRALVVPEASGSKKKAVSGPLPKPAEFAIFQGVVLQLNDKRPERPLSKQAIFLTPTAAQDIARVFSEYAQKGVDLMDPKTGCEIILRPEEQRGSKMMMFNAEVGQVVPVAEEAIRKVWVPWDQAFRRETFDEQLREAVRCFGHELVHFAFTEDYERLFAQPKTVSQPVQTVAKPQPAAPVVPAAEPAARTAPVLDLAVDAPPASAEAPADDEGTGAPEPVRNPKSPAALAQDYLAILNEDE